MDHSDHVRLIQHAIPRGPGVWADFGSGEGAFTLALRDLAGPECEIYSVEKDAHRLAQQERLFHARFPQAPGETITHFLHGDFTQPLPLPPLDGVVLANVLHFFRDKERLLSLIASRLKPAGKLVLVEYNVDHGNVWVPFPLAFPTFAALARRIGWPEPELIGRQPSRFLSEMYAALAIPSH